MLKGLSPYRSACTRTWAIMSAFDPLSDVLLFASSGVRKPAWLMMTVTSAWRRTPMPPGREGVPIDSGKFQLCGHSEAPP